MDTRKKNKTFIALAILLMVLVGILANTIPAFAAFNIDGTKPIRKGAADAEDIWNNDTRKGQYSTWDNVGSGFIVQPAYCNVLKKDSKTTFESFGKTCAVKKVTDAYDKDHPNAERADPSEEFTFAFDVKENSRGRFGAWIKNLRIYDAAAKSYARVDCRITVMDWEDETANTPNAHHVTIQKSQRSDINISGLNEATLKWDYFKAGTEESYDLKSNVTFDDIDATQYVAFKANQVLFQFAATDTRLEYKHAGGFNLYNNPDETNYPSGDDRNAFGVVYETDSLEFTYGTKNSGTWAHFGYLDYSMYEPTLNPPTKNVSDRDEKNTDQVLLSGVGETFTYKVQQNVPFGYAPSMFFKSFVMEDTLESCLEVVSATVELGNGDDTDAFNVNVNGQKVTATAKSSALRDETFYNKDYVLRIKAKLKDNITREQLAPYLTGDMAKIPNQGIVTIDDNPRTTSEVITKVWMPEPTKRVSDSDETKVISNTIPSRLESFTYDIAQEIPSEVSGLTKFGFTDRIESCLELKEVKILEGAADVTGGWNVSTAGNQVEAFARNPGKDLASKTYTMRISVQVKNVPDATLEEHGHYSADKSILNFKNRARMAYRIGDVTSDNGADTNQVDTTLRLPVDIKIVKDVDRYEHQVGDPINYTVKISHATDMCDASDVVAQDTDLGNFDLDLETAKVTGVTDYRLEPMTGGWSFTTPKLAKGQTATIQFQARAKKILNGTIVPNVATVKCFAVPEKSDKEEIYVNSPKMEVKKHAERSGYAVGETVDYVVEVTQINEGCFMRNVKLTDDIQTEGVKLLPGTLIIMDKAGKDVTKDMDVTFNGNKGFHIETGENFAGPSGTIPPTVKGVSPYEDLEFNTYLKIEYSAKLASDDLAGTDVENAAISPATENTNKETIKDDPDIPSGGGEDQAIVPVRGAELKITKASDKRQYKVGETGIYTVKVEQIRPDYAAKNVVIEDRFEEEGMEIQAGSVQVNHEGDDITEDCEITLDEDAAGYRVETGRNLAFGEEMRVTYDVAFLSEDLAGQEVTNAALTSADNAGEKETDHVVELLEKDPAITPAEPENKEAELDIRKTSDKELYEVGDPIHYALTVSSIGEKAAEQVVITDEIQTEGVSLVKDSIIVKDPEGNDMTETCEIQATENGFDIHTGLDLEPGETMKVAYQAMADQTVAGEKVENVSVADSDNTEEVTAEHEVLIAPDDEPEVKKVSEDEAKSLQPEVTNSESSGKPGGKAPQTGDYMPLWLVIGTMVLSGAAMIGHRIYKRRKLK